MSPVPKDVDGYLAGLPEEQRSALQKLRANIKAAAPEAAESISYGLPTYKYKGRPLVYLGAAKNHCALYGAIVSYAQPDELKPYDISKGTLRFPANKPLPDAFVKKLVKAQMKEIEAGAIGSKKKGSRRENERG